MFKKANPKPNFPEMENAVLEFWKANKIFEKQVQSKPENNKYVFYDGPPFITGLPHYGHLLGSISKDIIPRYQAMLGKRVERVWGWDCHGLPIENKVEKELGLKNRRDIESYGIDKFVQQCYRYTREVSSEWNWYIDHIGRWADIDRAYRTMDQDYMETVMWVFKQLHEKSLIYEGVRTSLFCTRCGTPVSNFEIAMDNSYRDMEDPAITVKFPIKDKEKFLKDINSKIDPKSEVSILAWTTTPWTMPSNRALVVDKDEDYVIAKVQKLDIELEKAWLVKEMPADLKKLKSSQITQAYLDNYTDEKGRNVKNARVRKVDGKFEFTVKIFAGNTKETGQMIEETREITKDEYIEYVKQATKKVVKTRYYYPLANELVAEIDVYQNNLQGFNVVEVEFPTLRAEKEFKTPEWFGKEVTDSNGIYPPKIADMTLEEVNAINEKYEQEPHSYDEHLQTDLVIVAKKRAEFIFKGMDYQIVEEFKGEKLVGLDYSAPYDFFAPNENDWKVYHYDGMVHMEEGTGIVHSAPGYGDIDTQMGQHYGLTVMFAVNDEGKYISDVKPWVGVYVKEADPLITAELKSRNLLFKAERIIHRYPFCYRCETPLIQKAQKSWFINVQEIKSDLVENNEQINWIPEHIKHGRFKKGLETAPDWGISRSRYWGTPMPVWEAKDADGNVIERVIVGSRDELMERNDEITKLILVRHGDREEGDDNGLTESGKLQAVEAAEKLSHLKIDAVLSSSMKRCLETAEPLVQELGEKAKVDERFGSLSRKQELYKVRDDKGVEWLSDLPDELIQERFGHVFKSDAENLKNINEEYKGKTIVAFTHGEVIAAFRHVLEGGQFNGYLKNTPNRGQSFTIYLYKGKLLDLHRPVIDDVMLRGDSVKELRRLPETLDVWMESASMPYAQKHYPFENKADVESNFPADYISEYIAQTRAWFYVMHVVSTALWNKPSFKNVVTTGVIMGNDGRKMSKSFKNYPDPRGVMEQYGGDALRFYLMSTPLLKAENVNIDENEIKNKTKDYLLPLWNSYVFLLTYAEIHNWSPDNSTLEEVSSEDALDKWIVAKFEDFVMRVREKLDNYDIPGATNLLPEFLINDLSKWYIRRSRDRFKDGDKQAMATLYKVLVNYSKAIAPFVPFVAEELWQNLVMSMPELGQAESVHLTEYPLGNNDNAELLKQMDIVRSVSGLGQSVRVENSLKIKQPLAKVEITADTKMEDWMKEIIKDELNVKEVIQTDKHSTGNGFLSSEDTTLNLKLTLDGNLTEELKNEGLLRELIRNIQAYRKEKGLKFGELVEMQIGSDDEKLVDVIKANLNEFSKAVNASKINLTTNDGDEIKVGDSSLIIKI